MDHYKGPRTNQMLSINNEAAVRGRFSKEEMDRYNNGWSVPDDPGFVSYIREMWLHHPSNSKVILPTKDYSQFGEKAIIDKLFTKQRNGFFFEVGALDGQLFSNTLNLELELNWTGILVEPDPYSYKKLLNLKRNAYSMNVCLSPNQSAILPFIVNSAMGTLVDTNRYEKMFVYCHLMHWDQCNVVNI